MNICLFEPQEIDKPLSKKDERGEHLIKILHKKAGDTFTAGIIGGSSGIATITEISDTDGSIKFTFEAAGEGKPLNPVKMIIGFPRPIQLKRLLRDVAALGVCEVHLTGTELGEKSYMQSTLVEKGSAYRMLLDGTVQAGSTHVPELFLHQNLKECLEAVSGEVLFALDNINPYCNLSEGLKENNISPENRKTVVAAIGSERGWTNKERELLEQKGYVRCGMGNRIMRTETAATVAGAVILNQLGW